MHSTIPRAIVCEGAVRNLIVKMVLDKFAFVRYSVDRIYNIYI